VRSVRVARLSNKDRDAHENGHRHAVETSGREARGADEIERVLAGIKVETSNFRLRTSNF